MASAIVPSPWISVILALATFRTLRLLAWDTFPPFVKARGWLLGEHVVNVGTVSARMGLTPDAPEYEYRYRRQFLADLFHCPFCLGLWLSGIVYIAWIYEPRATLYVAAPLALSAAAGLVAKNWDA